MEITEVRVKLVAGKNDKLRAFCSITIDNDFVVRDLKVIDGVKGPFVAMPSRKIMDRCQRCGGKNHYRARFCNDCGNQISRSSSRQRVAEFAESGERSKYHSEIAHPINSKCREVIQRCVLEKYEEEMEKSTRPGYVDESARFDDDYDDYFGEGRGEAQQDSLPPGGDDRRAHEHAGDDAETRAAPAGGREPSSPAFDEPGLARRSSSRSEATRERDSGDGRTDRGVRDESDNRAGAPRQPFRKRRPAEELEPEDNFGEFGKGILP